MSLCRGRLFFGTKSERRSQDSGVILTLNFNDSDEGEGDGDVDSSLNDVSMESPVANLSGKVAEISPGLWDSALGSPTPVSSPRIGFKSPCPRRTAALSPIPLTYEDSDEEAILPPPTPRSPCRSRGNTPPHKKLRSLRLYDTPHTPKSLLQKAQRRVTRVHRNTLSTSTTKGVCNHRLLLDPDGPQANVNPFTPNNNTTQQMRNRSLKRPRNFFDGSQGEESVDEEMEDDMPTNKKLALREINTSRYNEEFYQVCKLGDGEFGSAFKCINRLDGCIYAIKKSKTPVAGSVYERTAMNEVYAHAVLGKHPHVVRYYSAWAENDHMYIQNEFCDGGSLGDIISTNRREGKCVSETELKQVLLQAAKGLKYVHSQNLVHLDIKPANIFLQHSPQSTTENNMEEIGVEEDSENTLVTYKIGDLGHVTSMTNPVVEEGDCRYLPKEILQEQYQYLPKADIFSLALTAFEAGGGGELPKNGEAWHNIRNGNLPYLPHYSTELNALLKSMVHPDPRLRPSSATLAQHPVLCPFARKSRAELRRELNEEKFKNEMLSRQLLAATQSQGLLSNLSKTAGRDARLVGREVNRSMSLTAF